ncbi:FabD/lysophospholipase-like protein [Trichodelitschia bisporula]|uniref:FabD/lysophospholipase-like protein n=1 Tax=Trichodelitschia bisporula TaxID=703511 RepID=A0A6G1I1X5_9PEZI|nr:FabD/lysophospholipase-like protein [Trichodelitschia bisporula]
MNHTNHEMNPHAPLRLLTLDGGGVRGLASLMVLDDLMENIAREEKRLGIRKRDDQTRPKPCDYFDLIGGTSTGGIIAVLLGRLQLDVRKCIEIYTKLAEQIFKRDRSITVGGMKLPTGSTRFSGAVLEKAIKDALKELGHDEDTTMWDDSLFEEIDPLADTKDSIWVDHLNESPTVIRSRTATAATTTAESSLEHSTATVKSTDTAHKPHRASTWKYHSGACVHRRPNRRGCRTLVVSVLKNALGLPRILSTYDPNDRTTCIWQALRATSAAPTFFEEITFGTPKMTYLDGGMGFNNPSAEVAYAAKSIWEGRNIGVIVSVGTGLQTIPSVQKHAAWLPFGLGQDISLASALASMATGTARVDNEMQRMYYDSPTKYYRFDVDTGLADVSLEQWMKEDEMASLTEQYMGDPRQLRHAKRLGELLVQLSALPPKFEVRAEDFKIGMAGADVSAGAFEWHDLDFKTGFALGLRAQGISPEQVPALAALRSTSPSGVPGLAVDTTGVARAVLPVAQDLDRDGRREEARVATCVRADVVCLRMLRTRVPQGRYRVRFIVCFFDTEHTPPVDVVFSAGKPSDTVAFLRRFVDVRISPDIGPVLLQPDAVRVRVGTERWEEKKGRSWVEIEGDEEVQVGLDGALGIVVSRRFEEGVYVGGWSFGGVRLEPVFV